MSTKKALPTVEGKWLSETIFQATGGAICFDISYLKTAPPYSDVYYTNWYAWLERPNADIGRTIHAFIAPPRAKVTRGWGRTRIIWPQAEADLVVGQRADLNNRRRPPSAPGRWLSEDLWQDDEYGVCARDDALAEALGRSSQVLTNRRRHAHPALDPKVNGGRVRFRRVPKLSMPQPVVVSCLEDIEKVAAWERRQEGLSGGEVRAGWKNATEIRSALKITDLAGKVALSFALRTFRQERPDAAERRTEGRNAKNVLIRPWYYDPAAFDRWRNGRSVQEIAETTSRQPGPRFFKRLREAVLFLLFVLTLDPVTRKPRPSFSLRRFRRFVADPPAEPLQPRDPVPRADILAWAKVAGVEPTKMLKRAKKVVGVKYLRNGWQGTSCWYLPAPACVPRADGNVVREAGEPAVGEMPGQPGAPDDGTSVPTTRTHHRQALHEEWQRLHQAGKSYAHIARQESRRLGRTVAEETVRSAIKRLRKRPQRATAP
jgi:hypothetical protein